MALRLQRLRQGHERLMTYLLPIDADCDGSIVGKELTRLLRSIGARPLNPREERLVFGYPEHPLTWEGFVDQMLLS